MRIEQDEKDIEAERVTATVANFDNLAEAPYIADFLVDEHAVESIAPARDLRQAGIREEGEIFQQIDGEKVKLPYGFAKITVLGKATMTRIIFGPPQCEPVLGVLGLENLGIKTKPAEGPPIPRMAAIPYE